MEFTGERLILGKVDYELEVEHLNRYQFAQMLVKDKKVLDAACGSGYGSALLSKTAEQVVGIDISDEAIAYAKDNYLKENISFQVASVDSLPFDNHSFEAVVSFETLEHIGEKMQKEFLNEINRVLTEDGILIISTPNHDIYKERGINHFHEKELELKEFEILLQDRFKNVVILGQNFEVCNVIVGENTSAGYTTNRIFPEKSEYLIAVCSNRELPQISSYITIREDNKYKNLLNWAIKNHELNEQNNVRISQLETKIDEGTGEARNKEKEISALYNKIQFLEQQLVNKEGHIAQLLETDRELDRIKASRSWRYMGYVWKLRDITIPKGSKRRLGIKMAVKCIKMPRRVITMLSKSNVKKFFYYLKREGVSGVSKRIDDYIIKTDIQPKKLSIMPVQTERIKDITEYEKLNFLTWDKPEVSIIIPVYNQFDYTYNCLKSILQNSRNVNYEIIVANDCSTDLTTKVDEVVSGITLINNQTNLRFLKNCNNAAKYAKGKYLLFLNNDTQVQENWLEPLITLIESDKKIGLVGSKLVYPDGKLQEAGGIFWRDASAWNYGNRSDPNEPEYNYVKEVDYISGASIMISNKLWQEIGGFDENFAPAYCEDSDLAFTVRSKGYKVMYQPKSVVVHFEGISNGTDTSSGQKAYQVLNQKKFHEKWKNVLEREHFPNGENVFWARDRSKKKRTILFIDHYVPTYDKDAGSRTIYQYLKLVAEMAYNVKFIGDNFYKSEPYTTELEQMGIEVLYGSYYANHWKDWIKENGSYLDIVFMNRPHISEKYIDYIKAYTNSKIIYNVCDLHFLRERRQYEITQDTSLLVSAERWEKIEYDIMDKADIVFTLSTYERDVINSYFKMNKAMLCPIFIYDQFKEVNIKPKDKSDIIFVGGFRHVPNVDGVAWFIKDIYPLIQSKIPNIKFHIVGSDVPDKIKNMVNEGIVLHGFVSDTLLEELYKKCRVCIIPLRFGAGVKGKTIEAMYQQIAIVSTSTGLEGLDGIEKCISPKDSAEDFANQVVELYQNEEKVVLQAKSNLNYVQQHFSKESAKELFEMVFEK